MRKPFAVLLSFTLLATACVPDASPRLEPPDMPVTSPSDDAPQMPASSPLAPQPGDKGLSRANAYVDNIELRIMESYPVQIGLDIQGTLPTPCHQVRIEVIPPDADNRIVVDVYSVVDPNMVCAQVLADFEASLTLGSFPSGHYSVWVNGKPAGEFDT
jgi:inhibitor of cysteine peptidase